MGVFGPRRVVADPKGSLQSAGGEIREAKGKPLSGGGGGADELRSKVSRSIGWVVIERWGSRLLQLAVMAVLTRLVGADSFGLIALATSVVAVLQVFVDAGFSKALVQIKELGPKYASTASWSSVGLSVLIYIGLFFAAPLIGDLLGHDELTEVLRVMGAALVVSAFSQTPAALLERSFEFKTLSVRQLIAAVAGAAVALPVAFYGGGVWALVAQTLGTAVVACIVLWATVGWRPRFEYSLDALRAIIPIGLSISATELIDAVQTNIDKFVIGFVFAPDVLGYYYLAQRVGTILTELVTTVISRVSLTTFSRVQDDLPRLNRIFRQLTFVAGAIGLPIFALVAAFAEQLIPAIFGSGWGDAVPILWGLAAGWGLASVMYFDRTVLLARGRARSAFWVSVMQNVVGVVLLFALLPLGMVGVVISRWARVFVWPVRLLVLKRAIHLDVWKYISQILRVIVAIGPWVLVIFLLQGTAWAQAPLPLLTFVAPLTIVCLVVYSITIWALAGEENRAALRPIMKKFYRRR